MIGWVLTKVFGTQNERVLKKIRPRVAEINAFEPQLAVPVVKQLIAVPVIAAGIVSVTLAPMAFDGPLFVTTIVYVILLPAV